MLVAYGVEPPALGALQGVLGDRGRLAGHVLELAPPHDRIERIVQRGAVRVVSGAMVGEKHRGAARAGGGRSSRRGRPLRRVAVGCACREWAAGGFADDDAAARGGDAAP